MKLRSAALALLLFCQLAFAWKGEPVRFEAVPDAPFTVDLKNELSLKGPFLLLSGPTWLSVNSAGILHGTPAKSDEGKNEFELEVKSGNQWLQFSVVIEVGYPVRILKLFVAPWCTECLRILEELEPVLNTKDYPRLETKVYVETGADPYKVPTQKDADDLKNTVKSSFDFIADKWQWEEFKKYYKSAFQIPGAVLLGSHDKVLKVFPLGVSSEEIIKSVSTAAPVGAADNAILWVIDNSGSMGPHQAVLRRSLDKFFSQLRSSGTHWKMGVVTTDSLNPKGQGVFPQGYLWWNLPNVMSDFASLVDGVGTAGSGNEKSFESVLLRLKETPSFLDGVKKLNVIFFTDEIEQSNIGAATYLSQIQPMVEVVRHFGIFSALDMGCPTSGGADAWYYKGSAFDQVIRSGTGGVASMCSSSLAEDLGALARLIE